MRAADGNFEAAARAETRKSTCGVAVRRLRRPRRTATDCCRKPSRAWPPAAVRLSRRAKPSSSVIRPSTSHARQRQARDRSRSPPGDSAWTICVPPARTSCSRTCRTRTRSLMRSARYNLCGSERGPVALPVFKIGRSPQSRGGWVRLPGASAILRSPSASFGWQATCRSFCGGVCERRDCGP